MTEISSRQNLHRVARQPTKRPPGAHKDLQTMMDRFRDTAVRYLEEAVPQDTMQPGPSQAGPQRAMLNQRKAKFGRPMLSKAIVEERTRKGQMIRRR